MEVDLAVFGDGGGRDSGNITVQPTPDPFDFEPSEKLNRGLITISGKLEKGNG